MNRKERKKYQKVMQENSDVICEIKDERLFDKNEDEIVVSDIKNGNIFEKIKLKLTDDFTSRKFTMLLLAVIFFIYRPENFSADHLIYAMIIYAVGNAADKFLGNFNRQQ